VLPWRYDAEISTTNSLHTLACYGEYNERFGLVWFGLTVIILA